MDDNIAKLNNGVRIHFFTITKTSLNPCWWLIGLVLRLDVSVPRLSLMTIIGHLTTNVQEKIIFLLTACFAYLAPGFAGGFLSVIPHRVVLSQAEGCGIQYIYPWVLSGVSLYF